MPPSLFHPITVKSDGRLGSAERIRPYCANHLSENKHQYEKNHYTYSTTHHLKPYTPNRSRSVYQVAPAAVKGIRNRRPPGKG